MEVQCEFDRESGIVYHDAVTGSVGPRTSGTRG